MPAAAKMLADNNLTTGQVSAGTGKDGRVTKGDVIWRAWNQSCCQRRSAKLPPNRLASKLPAPDADLGDRPEQRVPMSRLRARIAERLLQSQSTNAILTTFNEVNMQPVMDLRNQVQGQVRERAWRQAGLHVVLRQGGGRTR